MLNVSNFLTVIGEVIDIRYTDLCNKFEIGLRTKRHSADSDTQ